VKKIVCGMKVLKRSGASFDFGHLSLSCHVSCKVVMPAKAGIHKASMDASFRWHDKGTFLCEEFISRGGDSRFRGNDVRENDVS